MIKKSAFFIILLVYLSTFTLNAEVEIGSVSAIIGEHYNEPAEIRDDSGAEIVRVPIEKLLVSMMLQFIWKQERNMLLLNLEVYGAMGSLEGSFAGEGSINGQIKEDTFFQGFFSDTPVYIKFGRYHANIPHNFGAFLTTGQVEAGFIETDWSGAYSLVFANWFNEENADGSFLFNNERFHNNDQIAHVFSFDYQSGEFGLFQPRLLIFNDSGRIGYFPSINHVFEKNSIINSLNIGYGWNNGEVGSAVLGIREEFTFSFFDFFWSNKLIFGLTSGFGNNDYNYSTLSLDNQSYETGVGSHFDYIYEKAGNLYGNMSLGIREEFNFETMNIWFGGSVHFVSPFTNTQLLMIGSSLAAGLKYYDPIGADSLFEIYLSWFIPGDLSVENNLQQRHQGVQVVVKLQQVIF